MRHEFISETDFADYDGWQPPVNGVPNFEAGPTLEPKLYTISDLEQTEFAKPEMLIENIIPKRGVSLILGAAKSCKTIHSVAEACAVATGIALFDQYRVLHSGPAFIVEVDDSAGIASIKEILSRNKRVTKNTPLIITDKVPCEFGRDLNSWLEKQIRSYGFLHVTLDSYTKIRPSRKPGSDIVKVENHELTELDEVGKKTNCAIRVVHHPSKGSFGMDWFDSAGGTYGINMAVESVMHMARFQDLLQDASERLVRIRGRHQKDMEMVVSFREETIDLEFILEGGAATVYPLLKQIRAAFVHQPFGPKELCSETGMSLRTAHRAINKLYDASAIQKIGYGNYVAQ